VTTTTLAAAWLDTAGPPTVWIVVLAFVFVECAFLIGLFLPGDTLLIAAGLVLAHGDHELSAWLLGVATTISAIAGNQTGYLVGRYTNRRVLTRRNGRILNRANLERATAFFDRWGFWAVVVARWVPWVRTLAPLIAGAGRMDARRYLLANTIGALVWAPTLIMLGYYGAGLLESVPWLHDAAIIGGVALTVLGVAFGLFRYWREVRRPVEEPVEQPVEQPAEEVDTRPPR
jgi:membrane-associated protein